MSTTPELSTAKWDRAYAEGRSAWRQDFGSHGPTLRERKQPVTQCPYSDDSALSRVLAGAWRKGYAQDVRR